MSHPSKFFQGTNTATSHPSISVSNAKAPTPAPLAESESSVSRLDTPQKASHQGTPSKIPSPHMDTPLISVIIPVYNVEPTLSRCLDSVQMQTYPNLEIILIDDGSTDRSGELCDSAAHGDPRIQVFHQTNQGLSAARNTGLDAMRGDFVTFVDSDDTIELDMIENLLDVIRSTDSDLAICSFSEIFPSGEKHPFVSSTNSAPSQNPAVSTPTLLSPRVYDTATALTHMLCEDGFTMSAWGKLYDRNLFQDVRFPVSKLYEDVGTTYRLILICSAVAFLPWPGYNYFQTSTSIIHQQFSFQKFDLIELTDAMCDRLDQYLAASSLTPDIHQDLAFAIKKRRMHARFSVLRQMIMVKRTDFPGDWAELKAREREIIRYLRQHKSDILANPLSTKRDKLAMRTLLLGLPFFKLAWKVYASRRSH